MERLIDELRWRGLVHQVTDDAVGDELERQRLTLYVGFDPSADSLQVGNLVQILNLVRFQRAGHRPIALAGGGTGLIGDPSGKTEERSLLDTDELKANLEAIRGQLERFLDFTAAAGNAQALLVDNGDWLWRVGLLEFLRDVGKHFTVNTMIAKESVRARLEEREHGISFTEFTYMLLQAYDFLHLHDAYGCRLQVGASDQWGNIIMGVDLIRRVRSAHAFGLTTPLVTDDEGRKLGKTETGTVWLDAAKTSPYQLYQYFVRTPDDLAGAYLRAFTFLERERVEELDRATAERPGDREAQRTLATEVTAIVHGDDEAARARRAAEVLFGEEIAELDEATLLDVFADAPSTDRPRTDLDAGLPLVDALVATGLTSTRSDARRQLDQGAVYVNNRRQPGDRALGRDDLLHDRYVVLRRGKKEHHLLRFG